jgi:hypothetical protein
MGESSLAFPNQSQSEAGRGDIRISHGEFISKKLVDRLKVIKTVFFIKT